MRTCVIGGGILGLTLAWRLAQRGHAVELFEASPQLGGLAGSHDYGEFVWDRFYHCILPQDTNLLSLLSELGLEDELRWTRTGTGYYSDGQFYTMNGTRDFLRFPLLSFLEKMRLGAAILYASRLADPEKLWAITAKEWLERICGRRTYRVFWEPLLKAKLGVYHDQVAAVFLWATIKRLFGARSEKGRRECLGYVHGGYRRILERFEGRLREAGASVHVNAPVEGVRLLREDDGGERCEVTISGSSGESRIETFEQVFYTGPARLAKRIVCENLKSRVEAVEQSFPTSSRYLGVVCGVLVLRAPLTPYYVLNIADSTIPMTGLIEMTNLIDPSSQANGRSLVYLPRYVDSEDTLLDESDEAIERGLVDEGVKRLFPELAKDAIVASCVHRARLVQPRPIAGSRPPHGAGHVPALERPFQMLGTYMLRCATLNNNEVVGLVDRFLRVHEEALMPSPEAARALR